MRKKTSILHYVGENVSWFALHIVLLIGGCCSNIAIAHFLKVATDHAIAKEWTGFKITFGALVGVVIGGMILKYLESYSGGRFTAGCITKVREDFMRRLLNIRIHALERENSGELLSIYTEDIRNVQRFFQSHLTGLIYQVSMTVAVFIYLFRINRGITLAVTMVIPWAMIITGYTTKGIRKTAGEKRVFLGKANGILRETLSGIETVKSFNLQRRFKREYEIVLNGYFNKGTKIDRKILYMDLVIALFQLAPYITFSLYGGYLLKNGVVSMGDMVAFLSLFDMMYMSICDVQYSIKDIKIDHASIKRVMRILLLKEESVEANIYACEENDRVIEFCDVSFSYGEDKAVLHNFNFSLDNGDKGIIIGENGCGKSTIFKLISGFYMDYRGEIKVFGRELRDWNMEKLREKIALVSQEVRLFPFTIRENIAFGREGATDDEILRASKTAHAHEFIMKLPKGYDTEIIEGGVNLSGGERQRVAIARALLKDAPILLLDEADSALDIESREHIEDALDKLMKGKTTLRITHRDYESKGEKKIISMRRQEDIL